MIILDFDCNCIPLKLCTCVSHGSDVVSKIGLVSHQERLYKTPSRTAIYDSKFEKLKADIRNINIKLHADLSINGHKEVVVQIFWREI